MADDLDGCIVRTQAIFAETGSKVCHVIHNNTSEGCAIYSSGTVILWHHLRAWPGPGYVCVHGLRPVHVRHLRYRCIRMH